MGKKYIIELLDDCPSEFKGIIVFGLTPNGQISAEPIPVEDLTPYTEPDMEQVRKDAYDKGFEDGKELCPVPEICHDNAYQKGLSDAWEAARKIYLPEDHGGLGYDVRLKIFNTDNIGWLFKNLSASEAIEKIRQYEQEREEKITKGDIVRIKSAPEVEILVTFADETYFSGIALTEVDGCCEIGDQYTDIAIHKVEKTGRHYEIAEVLKKMKGKN